MSTKQFNYTISWRSRNNRYGNNLSSKIGNDFEYSGSKNFNDHPDLTRIDIKNSITDPYDKKEMEKVVLIFMIKVLQPSCIHH